MSAFHFPASVRRWVKTLVAAGACLLVVGCAGYSYGVSGSIGTGGYYGYRPAPYYYYGSPFWYSPPYRGYRGYGYRPYYRPYWGRRPYWGYRPYHSHPRPFRPRRWR